MIFLGPSNEYKNTMQFYKQTLVIILIFYMKSYFERYKVLILLWMWLFMFVFIIEWAYIHYSLFLPHKALSILIFHTFWNTDNWRFLILSNTLIVYISFVSHNPRASKKNYFIRRQPFYSFIIVSCTWTEVNSFRWPHKFNKIHIWKQINLYKDSCCFDCFIID